MPLPINLKEIRVICEANPSSFNTKFNKALDEGFTTESSGVYESVQYNNDTFYVVLVRYGDPKAKTPKGGDGNWKVVIG
jgi:hypothetical protein